MSLTMPGDGRGLVPRSRTGTLRLIRIARMLFAIAASSGAAGLAQETRVNELPGAGIHPRVVPAPDGFWFGRDTPGGVARAWIRHMQLDGAMAPSATISGLRGHDLGAGPVLHNTRPCRISDLSR